MQNTRWEHTSQITKPAVHVNAECFDFLEMLATLASHAQRIVGRRSAYFAYKEHHTPGEAGVSRPGPQRARKGSAGGYGCRRAGAPRRSVLSHELKLNFIRGILIGPACGGTGDDVLKMRRVIDHEYVCGNNSVFSASGSAAFSLHSRPLPSQPSATLSTPPDSSLYTRTQAT